MNDTLKKAIMFLLDEATTEQIRIVWWFVANLTKNNPDGRSRA